MMSPSVAMCVSAASSVGPATLSQYLRRHINATTRPSAFTQSVSIHHGSPNTFRFNSHIDRPVLRQRRADVLLLVVQDNVCAHRAEDVELRARARGGDDLEVREEVLRVLNQEAGRCQTGTYSLLLGGGRDVRAHGPRRAAHEHRLALRRIRVKLEHVVDKADNGRRRTVSAFSSANALKPP